MGKREERLEGEKENLMSFPLFHFSFVSLFVVFSIFLTSCGYSFGFKMPQGVKSIEVPIFENKTLIRGIEFEITNLLTEELKARSQLSIVTSGGNAVLRGAVVGYSKTALIETGRELIAGRITVRVLVRLECLGETVIDNQEFAGSEEFDRRTGGTEDIALRGTVREIAQKILFEMQEY
jgi:hypothetical protein